MKRSSALLSLAVAVISMTACATSAPSGMNAMAPSPDPRIGLRAGWFDAAETIWNLDVVSKTQPSEKFLNLSTPGDRRLTNSDLAFSGNYVYQGNYSGWQVWDISNPRRPTLRTSYVCPGSQSDVTVYQNLLFVSAEATSGRVDCGLQGVADTVSTERARGIRIIDISDIGNPRYVTTVQTCRGSHTNTLVEDLNDKSNVYIYVSGSASARSSRELAGCSDMLPAEDPNSSLFKIEVIQVPLAHPEQAKIVSQPRIFEDLKAPARHAETAADSALQATRRPTSAADSADNVQRRRSGRARATAAGLGPTQCHDITAYPAIGLAGGACAGYGFLLDIRDVAHPVRIAAVADSNFSFWHSATFNNDGTKILFSDEWGGGTQPRCRVTDKPEWGADAIFTLSNNQMRFQSYYKMPAAQTSFENCVAHNGSLIPVPGRDIMVQSWYQGGISVFDWTDASHPREIAYFDRGPMDSTKLVDAGYWSSYWYNGYIVASEISRGLDIFALKPSAFLSQNEIDAARSVRVERFNAQEQPRIVWPASFAVVRSYLDQLVRNRGLKPERTTAIATELAAAEQSTGAQRSSALTQLATELDRDAMGATDAARVQTMARAVRDLAR